MDVSSKTAQLAILHGGSRNSTPGAGVFDFKSPWGAGTLYVFVEGTGLNLDHACRYIAETIGREFKASNRSLTSSLNTAIRTAHQELAGENQRSMPDQRVVAGVTCAVLRDGQVYFAQAGPAVAYARLNGQISRLPEASSRALPSWSTPLGGNDAVHVSFFHHHVQPGDVILMASSMLAATPVESDLPELLALQPDAILLRLGHSLKDATSFSALAVRFEHSTKRSGHTRPLALKEPGPGIEISSSPARASSLSRFGSALSRVRLPRVDRDRASKALRSLLIRRSNGKRLVKTDRTALGRPVARVPKYSPALAKDVPKAEVQTKLAKAKVKGKGSGLDGPKTDSLKPLKGRRSRGRSLRLPLFLLMLLMAGLIACSLVTLYNRFTDRQDQDKFESALSSATTTRERALVAGDLARTRSLLNDADHMVNDALFLNKSDAKARTLKQRILADTAKLNAVVRLPNARVLTDLTKVEGGAKNLTNLIVEGEDAYVLDRGTSRVYQFGIDLATGTLKVGRNTFVAKKGDKVGNIQIGDLVSVLWMGQQSPFRPSSNLLLFDSARNLFQFTPGKGLTSLAVRDTGAWQNPALAMGYNANLYILDPSASQIWRYFPTDDGYNSPMRGLLENSDIRDAVDFAIDVDIYVLTRGGNVLKFVGGRYETFDQDQLDKRLTNPTAIVISPASKSVYVLDAGNNRVVVFSKDGKFQRQFVGEALEDNPRSLYVDEARGKIYVLTDKKLYLSDLPK
ncbi:MAG: hypothetical protein Q7O66_04670 [Dehalococcoidia bacterium]|nr:hypothetical protein [Dehalococcoidia bacterium]